MCCLSGALVLAGCMTGPSRNVAYRVPNYSVPSQSPSVTTYRIPDPRTEPSPRNRVDPAPPPRGFDSSRTIPEATPESNPESSPETATVTPTPEPRTVPETSEPPASVTPEEGPTLNLKTEDSEPRTLPPLATTPATPVLPKSNPPAARKPAKLELLVNVPKRKQVGSPAAYRLLVRNMGTETAEDVDIHCQFDPQLTFDNSEKREVRHRLGRLFPGESKELTLHLVAKSAGVHGCRFSVKSRQAGDANDRSADQPGVEAVWKAVNVEFVSQQVQIEMLGPTLRTVGSRAEFNFKITNRSKKLLPKVRVVLQHDAAIAPAVVTQGATRDKLSLAWEVSDFKIDETAQFQVDFDCKTPAHRVCLQLDVSGNGIPDDRTETCLQILPVLGALDLQISDRDDPIVLGKRPDAEKNAPGRYEITVFNRGLQPAPQVRLDVNVSPLLKVLSAQVQTGAANQATKLLPLKYELTNGRLLFDAVPTLAPDDKLVYIVEVEGVSQGVADVRATLRSGLNNTAVSTSEPTWVVAD